MKKSPSSANRAILSFTCTKMPVGRLLHRLFGTTAPGERYKEPGDSSQLPTEQGSAPSKAHPETPARSCLLRSARPLVSRHTPANLSGFTQGSTVL